jgi:formate hydrogenlyase subunit 3/multisubunit Na+/H+ antiporter MnhD subunit
MMWNQPSLWLIGLPLLAAGGLWPAGRRPREQAVAGAAAAWLLALWLWSLDPAAGEVAWSVYGRCLALTPGLQTLLVALYLSVGLLSLLSWPVPAGPRFVPTALAMMAPAAALLMIRPLHFAAPFWLAVVVLALLLFRYEDGAGLAAVRAAQRYWLLMLVATALLLVAVWMLAGAPAALLPGARLLALALGISLAGFPFFIWVRPLGAAVPLLAVPLLLALLPLLLLAFFFQLLLVYPALGQTDAFLLWLPWSGGLTVLLAGFLTLSGGSWRHLWGSLILLDMGFGLLALALAGAGGWETAVAHHGLRLVSLLLVVVGFRQYSVFRNPYSVFGRQYSAGSKQSVVSGEQDSLFGVKRETWGGWLLLYGLLSLLGLPLTPGFGGRWALLVELGRAETASLPLALLLIGGMGLALLGVGRRVQIALAEETEAEPGTEPAAPEAAWRRWAAPAALFLAVLLAAVPHLLLVPLAHLATRLQG